MSAATATTVTNDAKASNATANADGTTPAADDATVLCSLENLLECDDRCTLDGAREKNPACLEHESCYPDTGVCYDPCVTYQVASQKDVDVFDATCANRIARDAAEALVASSHASPLRDPPTVGATSSPAWCWWANDPS